MERTYGVDLFDPNHKEGVKKLINSPEYRYLRNKQIGWSNTNQGAMTARTIKKIKKMQS